MPAESPVAVRALDVILLWPFRLHSPGKLLESREFAQMSPSDWLKQASAWVTQPDKGQASKWQQVSDFYRAGEATGKADQYAEFVYFHPFVRNAVYGGTQTMAVFERDDIGGMSASFAKDKSSFTAFFGVQFCRLMVFPTDVGLLSIHLRLESICRPGSDGEQQTTSHASIGETQIILDRIRRLYAPYYDDHNNPGGTPKKVEWTDTNGKVLLPCSDYQDVGAVLAQARERRQEKFSAHWESLIAPLALKPESGRTGGFSLSQLMDERIPLMAYIAVDPVRSLSEGDFERFALLDSSNGNARPYAREFLDKQFTQDFCYDRFWQREPCVALGKEDGAEERAFYSTRYLCSGYGFCAVGQAGTGFFDDLVRVHFRRHYYTLGVLALMHKASLLGYWQRLAELVAEHSSERKCAANIEKYNRKVRWLMSDLADFDAQWYFSEVSNQVQAQELFDLWSNRLRTPRLYREVMEQARFMREVQLNQVQEEVADVQTRLNQISTKWLPFLGAAALLGMELGNPAVEEWFEQLAYAMGWPKTGVVVGATILTLVLLWVLIWLLQEWMLRKNDRKRSSK